MQWTDRFESHPRFGQAVRFATARPSWVLRATGLVAGITLILPAIALILLLASAAVIIFLAWIAFSALDRLLRALTPGGATPRPNESAPCDDGRDNVRVIQRV